MFLGYQNGKIKFYTEKELQKDFYNLDKVEFTENEYVLDGDEYILKDEAYIDKKVKEEEERIKMLKMTRGDLFEYTIVTKGLDKDDIRAMIEQEETLDLGTKKLYLNRLDNALHFFRGHPAVDFIGAKLGLTKEDLDTLFKEKGAVD